MKQIEHECLSSYFLFLFSHNLTYEVVMGALGLFVFLDQYMGVFDNKFLCSYESLCE